MPLRGRDTLVRGGVLNWQRKIDFPEVIVEQTKWHGFDIYFVVVPHKMQAGIFRCNGLSCLYFLSVQRVDALARLSGDKPEVVVKLVEEWRVKLRA
jgi:hypothetical protein